MYWENVNNSSRKTLLEDISPGSKGNGGESIYGATFEGWDVIRKIILGIVLIVGVCLIRSLMGFRWMLCHFPLQARHSGNGKQRSS